MKQRRRLIQCVFGTGIEEISYSHCTMSCMAYSVYSTNAEKCRRSHSHQAVRLKRNHFLHHINEIKHLNFKAPLQQRCSANGVTCDCVCLLFGVSSNCSLRALHVFEFLLPNFKFARKTCKVKKKRILDTGMR